MRGPLLALFAWIGLALAAPPASAQVPSAEISARIGDLGAVLQGQGDPAELFTRAFLDQVSADQVRTIARQLAGQYGAYRGAPRIVPASQYAATFDLEYERARVHMNVSLDPQPPHRINGWFITGADVHGDTLAAVMSEVAALPGTTSAAVVRLGDGAPAVVAGTTPDRPLAIGSTFKLFMLAELSRQIRAGQRHWSDVVPIDRRSVPSGMLQTWPRGAPVTLHTLAALMISISDNSAADMLLHILGRENVERMTATIGLAEPDRNRPFLSTLELFAIKTGPDSGLAAWRAADEAGRRRLLAGEIARADADQVDLSRLAGQPDRARHRMVCLGRRYRAGDGLAAAQRRCRDARDPRHRAGPARAACAPASPMSASRTATSPGCSTIAG